jgi:shikimate kinase
VNVILIGYRGTGKTSVGRLLAAKLGRPFLDSDELIKASSGKSVREMVAEKGWSFFRREEKRVVAELAANDDCVVALGGGAVLDEENVRNLKPKGFLIWLTAGAQTIVGRLNGDGKSFEQRPPLAGKDPDEETRSLLKAREPLYAKIADCRVDTSDLSIEEAAAEVFRILGERTEANPGKRKHNTFVL